MNASELKSHFYKRFTGENGRMTFAETGLPCSLLGYMNTEHMPSVGCAMSMGVKAAARKIGSGTVVITTTETDICRVYDIEASSGGDRISVFLNRAKYYGISGTQLLCDSSVPECFDSGTAYTASAAKALLELSKRGMPRPEECAALCAQRGLMNEYLTAFACRRGYGVYADTGSAKLVPLPMTGLKFIIAAARKNVPPVNAGTISRAYMLIKELYPHITSFSDVSAQMLDIAAPRLRPKEIRLCAGHLSEECRRVSEGVRALTRCDIRAFAEIMSRSYYSQRRLCSGNDERIYLTDMLLREDAVLGARMFEQGIAAIVDESRCDEVMRSVGFAYESEFGAMPIFCVADGI